MTDAFLSVLQQCWFGIR